MPRNQARYHNGRSAIARRVLNGGVGNTNGMMPQGRLVTFQGNTIGPKHYFGGNMKAGSAPSATGNAAGRRGRVSNGPRRANYLFTFKTNPGPAPWGYGPHA